MVTVVGFLLILALVIILVRGKLAITPVLIILPIIAAFVCGFSVGEISGFINQGLQSVFSVVVLFAFAIIYFNLLNDVGMFDVFVKGLMKRMGNRIELVFLITCLVAAVSHLDGSGSTTMIITIPAMLPIYKKMKLSPLTLLLFVSLSSGIMNMNPWCPAPLTLAATIGIDPQATWQAMLPVQIVSMVLLVGFCFLMARFERKRGAGVSSDEFKLMQEGFNEPTKTTVSKKVLLFDFIITLVLIVTMLLGWVPASICFMVAISFVLVINFKGGKAQMDAIKRHGGVAVNMILIMLAIGVLTGITQQTGMIAGMTGALLSIIPASLGSHLVFIIGLLSPFFGILLGNAATHTAMAPILSGVVTQYGATATQLATVLISGTSFAANLSVVSAAPYLALGLADVEMGAHLKYSFKWVLLFNTLFIIAAAIFGVIMF